MFREWLADNRVEDYDFSSPLFPKAKERKYWSNDRLKRYIETAEGNIGYEWPAIKASDYIAFKTESSRLRHEDIHFKRREVLNSFIMAELCEYKGRFIPYIVDGIFSVCEETYWGLSAHFPPANYRHNIPEPDDGYIDLFAGETAAGLAIVYYIFYDELYAYCPEILTRIEYEMNRRIIKSYLTHRDWFWQGYTIPINNWNPWIISNILTVILIVEKSKTVRDEGIKKLLFEIDNIYKSYPEDGGCDEGATYWGVSGGAVCEFCEQLYTATGGKINFFKDKKLQEVAKYPSRVYIGEGYVANFADGSNYMNGAGKQVIDSYIYGRRMGNEALMSFAGELTNQSINSPAFYSFSSNLRAIIYRTVNLEDILSRKNFKPLDTEILPDLQNTFIRRGDWYSAAKGGNNAERHNHNDIGSFILYYKNSPVLVDPSCGVYTANTFHGDRYGIWTMQSGWHNTPVINGKMQKNGDEFTADGFEFKDGKTLISFAKAYEESAGVKILQRSISLDSDGAVICDRFEFNSDTNTVCEHFITPLEVQITADSAIIGGEFVISSKGAAISTDSVDFEGDRNLKAYWGTEKMNRVIFTYNCKCKAEIEIKIVRKS